VPVQIVKLPEHTALPFSELGFSVLSK